MVLRNFKNDMMADINRRFESVDKELKEIRKDVQEVKERVSKIEGRIDACFDERTLRVIHVNQPPYKNKHQHTQ
jgi:predicted  nucleic acid-binding Zn-ribbon protein